MKRGRVRLYGVALLCLAALVGHCPWARGERTIGVAPTRIQLAVSAGEAVSGEVQVVNAGDEPFTVEASATSWTVNARGERVWQDLPPEQRGANLWVTLAPRKFRLAPKQLVRVRYTVTVPREALGGYRAMLVFKMLPEPGAPKPSAPGQAEGSALGDEEKPPTVTPQLAFIGRVGVPLYLDVEGPAGEINPKGELVRAEVIPPRGAQPLSFAVHFRNEGNTHLNLSGLVVITDSSGKVLGRVKLDSRVAIPGFITVITAPFQGELAPGKYGALITLEHSYKDKAQVSVSELEFSVYAEALVLPTKITRAQDGSWIALPTVRNSGFLPVMVAGKWQLWREDGEVGRKVLPPLAIAAGLERSAAVSLAQAEQRPLALITCFAWAPLSEPTPEPPPVVVEAFSVNDEGRPTVVLRNTGSAALFLKGLWQWLPLDGESGGGQSAELPAVSIAAGARQALACPIAPESSAAHLWALSLMAQPPMEQPAR